MNRLQKDPELRYFDEHLKHKVDGALYLTSWEQMRHAQHNVMTAMASGDAKNLARWRRLYITAGNNCSSHLQILERRHGWPTP
jgi:hypothetical protein